MSPYDLQRLSVGDLLRLEASVGDELMRRGVSRTASSLGGEVSEHLALQVYGGELSPPSTASFDLVDLNGRRIQVKSRTLPSDDERFFAFKSLDFDLAVCLRFDRKSNDLEWAREFSPSELQTLGTRHAKGLRLPTRRAYLNGRDASAPFRAALEAMET